MCGKDGNIIPENVPVKLQLDGKNLPWVPFATHLGHEIHQSCTMDYDVTLKRAIFIGSSVDIREKFGFAQPEQILKAARTYSLHLYGGMLWDFTSDKTGQMCKAWNMCVKLVYQVPRNTRTFIVEHYFAEQLDSVMKELFSRYVNFVKSLRDSSSSEIKNLFEIIGYDPQSNTGRNLYFIRSQTGMDPYSVSPRTVRNYDMRLPISTFEKWRIPLLDKLISRRRTLQDKMGDTEEVDGIINSLCTT